MRQMYELMKNAVMITSDVLMLVMTYFGLNLNSVSFKRMLWHFEQLIIYKTFLIT